LSIIIWQAEWSTSTLLHSGSPPLYLLSRASSLRDHTTMHSSNCLERPVIKRDICIIELIFPSVKCLLSLLLFKGVGVQQSPVLRLVLSVTVACPIRSHILCRRSIGPNLELNGDGDSIFARTFPKFAASMLRWAQHLGLAALYHNLE